MPNINIDDAYILGETGAQVDKVTGLFTKDENTTNPEKAFAQLNIGNAGSNRNLLDNPWFTVNQRQITSGQGNQGYIADRWGMTYGNGGVIYSRTDDTITIQSANGLSHGDIFQKLEPDLWNYLNGKTVTLSVMLNDYSIRSATFTFDSTATKRGSLQYGLDGNAMSYECSLGNRAVQIWKYYTPETYRAAKLELGSVSTLANDAPPDYGTELAKCGRYFFRAKGDPIAVGYVSSNLQYVYVSVPALAPMRATPTISYSGGFTARLQVASIAITSMYASTPLTTGNAIGVRMVLASSASATGPAAIYGGANDYIDLSADL